MRINLPTGKTIEISYYEWLFMLKEEDVQDFYQSCIADDLGIVLENPFSSKFPDKLEIDEENNVQNYFENPIE